MCPFVGHIAHLGRTIRSGAMPSLILVAVVLAAVIAVGGGGVAVAVAGPALVTSDAPRSPFVAVGRAVRPAVVSIRISRAVGAGGVDRTPLQELYRQFFPDEEGKGGRFENPGTGSGFVVASTGEVLTNHHVVAGADRIFVRFPGEAKEYQAELAGSDPLTDLALLRFDPAGRDLPYLAFGDSDQLEVGDWVVAVGNPFGNLEGSMTVGILSAKGRGDLSIQGLTPRYQDFLQTDASINFGNSGGPLVDLGGRVVGVNTAVNTAGQGIGFAVPSRMVRHIYQQLAAQGRVIRGWLGASALDADGAVMIGRVVPDSPAAVAGLADGDRLLSFAGTPVSSQRQLLFLVAETPVGQPVACEVERQGARRALTVTLTELDPARLDTADRGLWLGLEVADLGGDDPRTVRLKESYGLEATSGVIVVKVEPERPGAEAGIRPGDVLVAIEDHELTDLAAWKAARAALSGRRDALNVLVRTGTNERFVQVTPRDAGTLQ
ncbi:MAG: trypsin-like peptidase domain-containing protein [Candidatus Krumholzibacteriia bacterium]